MADADPQFGLIISTALVSLLTGYALGVFASRGYIVPPELAAERRAALADPEESDESDVEEDSSILDHAPNWANGLAADKRQGLRADAPAPAVVPRGNLREECKLVLVVRTDLGMTKGKIAAQCGHATLACYLAMASSAPGSEAAAILARWQRLGQAKIAVAVKSQEEMLELRRRALALGITAEYIQDAGRTQIEAGSMTVLGVGPAPKSVVDQVTSHLKLL